MLAAVRGLNMAVDDNYSGAFQWGVQKKRVGIQNYELGLLFLVAL